MAFASLGNEISLRDAISSAWARETGDSFIKGPVFWARGLMEAVEGGLVSVRSRGYPDMGIEIVMLLYTNTWAIATWI